MNMLHSVLIIGQDLDEIVARQYYKVAVSNDEAIGKALIDWRSEYDAMPILIQHAHQFQPSKDVLIHTNGMVELYNV